MKRRVVIAGLGSIGQRHARLLLERPTLDVEFCESNPAILADAQAKLGVRPTYSSFEAALATSPEFVVIATPHALHAPMTCAALRTGAHVLCEKPMSDSLVAGQSMATAANETQRTLRIGFMLRFHPAIRRLKELIRDGVLGSVLQARYAVGSRITLENSRSRYQRDVFGALVMDYVHGFDLLLWLLGTSPVSIYARGLQAGRLDVTSNPNVLAAVLDYSEPLLAEVHIDYVAKPEQHGLELLGDRGWARLNILTGDLQIEGATTTTEHFKFERDQFYRAQFEAFLEAAAGKDSDIATAADGLKSVALLEAAIGSLRSGQREMVEPS